MSITDELREYTEKQVKWLDVSKVHYRKLFSIADRIDAEHQKACDDAWDNGYESDYLGIEKWLTEHPQVMEHHGWVRLPKDADGEYIHLGDKMECFTPQHPDVPKVFEVQRILMDDVTGWRLVAYPATYAPEECRHHHIPTVEDVLREMHAELDEVTALYVGEVIDSDERNRDEARIFAEYAAKLRLAETEDA